MAQMRLDVITAEREVLSDEVDLVVAPGSEGELGILPNHSPLMTTLKEGELTIRKGGEDTYLAVTGGFLEVMDNVVTVLADACERSEEISEERAQEAMRRAQEMLSSRGADVDLESTLASMRRAQLRIRVARRRRQREVPPSALQR
jgi:F-type H+-transporting ATPase subunit epsilon